MPRIALPAALSILLLLPVTAAPARADHDGWSLGAGFWVGGVQFALAFGAPRYNHRPDYYYVTDDRFGHRGHRCSDRCFRGGGYAYHALSCPVVGYHMDRFHQRPHLLFRGYAPAPYWDGRYYGRDDHSYRSGYGRDGYYDYDDDRHGKDHRYRGRGRGHDRHHRHDRSCGHDWRHRPHR